MTSIASLEFASNFLRRLKLKSDDDSVDRLNYYYTCLVLLFFASMLSAKQYVGKPIQCWVPAEFKDSWEEYSEDYCFIENTYYVSQDREVPHTLSKRDELQISYYQWVPFILAGLAIMFHIPRMFWRAMNWHSGVNVRGLIGSACSAKVCPAEIKQTKISTICGHLNQCASIRDQQTGGGVAGWGRQNWGIYVTFIYLLVKILYVINVVGQFFVLNRFIGGKGENFWGVTILSDLSAGRQWNSTGHFPRVTLCDLGVRFVGQQRHYTLQCVLMINMFNEKVFLFLWWWFIIVAVLTILNLFYWLIVTLSPSAKKDFIKAHLRVNERLFNVNSNADQKLLTEFVHQCLRPDILLVLRLIADNAGDITASLIIQKMFSDFKSARPVPKDILPLGRSPEKLSEKEALLESSEA